LTWVDGKTIQLIYSLNLFHDLLWRNIWPDCDSSIRSNETAVREKVLKTASRTHAQFRYSESISRNLVICSSRVGRGRGLVNRSAGFVFPSTQVNACSPDLRA